MLKNYCETFLNVLYIESEIGLIYAQANEKGITKISFYDGKAEISEDALVTNNDNLNALKTQLNEYFEGKRFEFELNLANYGSAFNQKISSLISSIPEGETYSYKKLAELSGDINAVRAVANVNAKNPFLIVIPCHRVIGSDDSLTGYAGGLHRKEWLLNHELKFANKPFQTQLF